MMRMQCTEAMGLRRCAHLYFCSIRRDISAVIVAHNVAYVEAGCVSRSVDGGRH